MCCIQGREMTDREFWLSASVAVCISGRELAVINAATCKADFTDALLGRDSG